MDVFILDVDGVMTNGQFHYSSDGKIMKVFGPDDADALKILNKNIEIRFLTADIRGYKITEKRIVEDMKYKLDLVSSLDRLDWISKNYNLKKVIYMGDGFFDSIIMNKVGYSIAPNNSDKNTIKSASYVTERNGGERAVSEACMHIMDKFFELNNIY